MAPEQWELDGNDVEVGDLATRTATFPATLRCGDVERLFTRDPSRSSIIVARADGTPLLVDRVSFLNAMLGPLGYGGPLNHERPVEALLDSLATFTVPAGCPATDAYEALLGRPASRRFGPLVVEYPDGTFGTLAAALLLEHVARVNAAEALRDPLTGLANRNCLLDSISRKLQLTGSGRPVGLLFIDLDRFKVVNDGLGHGAGDQLLMVVADRIRSCVDSHNLAARLGGDEFAVLIQVQGGDVLRAAARYAERIQESLNEPVAIAAQEVYVSASVGIAVAQPGESASTLIRRGDIAMYQAKRRGGGYYFFEESDDAAASRRLDIEAWLRQALSDGTLAVHYQPIVSLSGGRLTGFEALARGFHPALGKLGPDQFLPVAEEVGLLPAIDHHVLRTALRAAAAWRTDAATGISIAVNLSAASLRDDSLLTIVPEALAQHALAPGSLTLEVTESAMLQNPARTAELLHSLHQLGVRIAIDDFGTGYSSLTQLTTFHADVLKIDEPASQLAPRPAGGRARAGAGTWDAGRDRRRGDRGARTGCHAGTNGLRQRPGLPVRRAVPRGTGNVPGSTCGDGWRVPVGCASPPRHGVARMPRSGCCSRPDGVRWAAAGRITRPRAALSVPEDLRQGEVLAGPAGWTHRRGADPIIEVDPQGKPAGHALRLEDLLRDSRKPTDHESSRRASQR